MKLSVIVSTYNSPRYLDLVLDGLSRQNDLEFECIVADDGSTEETKKVISKSRGELKVIHSWQEDKGFRLAASRNLALSMVSGDHTAFLDGDCIPTPEYAADIKRAFTRLAKFAPRTYLQGHRVILGEALSKSLSSSAGIFSGAWLMKNVFELSNLKNGIRHPAPLIPHDRLRGVRGCSMAFRMEDLIAINGFDEEFEGWGHEDRDLVSRLFRSGVRRADLRGSAAVYHLYHREAERKEESRNLRLALGSRPIRAERGLVRNNPIQAK